MQRVIPILTGAAFTVALCETAGLTLLRRLRLRLTRAEEWLFAFVTGAAAVSLMVFLLCVVHQARIAAFVGIGCVSAAGLRPSLSKTRMKSFPSIYWLYLLSFAIIFFVYFFNAVAPEVSPDGSGYHLGNVRRLWEVHGFVWDYHSMYSYFPQGMEMLFLVAYSIGGFPAAAIVHLVFLCALALLLVSYGRRFGYPNGGIFAAILIFASPIIGLNAVSAYNDVALATCIFAVFYLIQVQREDRASNALLVIGLLAGFAYAIKYTGWIALPFAVIALRGRGLAYLLPSAALIAAPWALRNWIWVGNPFAPFLNSWFPNSFYSAELESSYLRSLREIEPFQHWWQIPLDMTISGAKLPGFLGPVFLLSPFALLALRRPQGRRLLAAAAVFSIPMILNPGVRFLIPGIPFLALAMGLALQNSPGVIPALAAFHVVLSLPAVMPAYCADWAWRITSVPVRVALGLEAETPFLQRRVPDYWLKYVIDNSVPEQKTIFSFGTRAEAYLDRRILVGYESSLGDRARQLVWARKIADLKPMGIDFLLLNDTDFGIAGIEKNMSSLGLSLIEKGMERAYTVWTKAVVAALFAIVVFRAATRPVTIHEAVLWDHLIGPPVRQAFVAPDAWGRLLYAIAARRAIGIFSLSEFALRVPAVIAGAAYLFGIARRTRLVVAILLAIPPVLLGWFSTATPHGIALALAVSGTGPWQVSEVRRALYCGFAVAFSPAFAVPLAALAAWQTVRHGIAVVERIAIPAATAAFILLIFPLSHAAPLPQFTIGGREETEVRAALRSLRNRGPVRISAAPPVLPLVEFYRARYRQRDWEITNRDPQYRIGVHGSFEP